MPLSWYETTEAQYVVELRGQNRSGSSSIALGFLSSAAMAAFTFLASTSSECVETFEG
ncbi:hypothetical protein OHB07_34250 [Streptomyces sp. NBC_00111]|uniref:hypothetical protein n=1 Tax=unclassified Streptomyces TaxID=2593676 RepID=UPI002E2EC1C3|nr:hypothetical protein [Streptomyces sp. NBC_01460]